MKTEKTYTPLSKYMDEKGINLTEFSRMSGITVSVVHAIYHGHRKPKPWTAMKIKKATKGAITDEDLGLK